MDKSIFDNLIVPIIKFEINDQARVSFSEIKDEDGKKTIFTYIWKNQQLLLINAISGTEYIFKDIKTGKTSKRGTFAKHIFGNSNYGYSISSDITCKNEKNEKNKFLKLLDIEKESYYLYTANIFAVVEKYIKLQNDTHEELLRLARVKRENVYFNKFKEPKFTKGFFDYCKEWIEKNDRMFISKNRRNGEYKGYCTHCGCKLSLSNYYFIGYNLTCPCCGENISFRFDHKDDTQIMFVANVGYFEKINGEIAIRLFHIYRRERGIRYDDLSEKDFKEYARYVITDKKVYCWLCEYRHGMGNHWDECNWYSTGFRVFDGYFALYNNIEALKVKSPLLKFKNIIERKAHTDTELFKITAAQRKYPCIEYLQAQGWVNIIRDIIYGDTLKTLNPKGETTSEVFGIDVNKIKKYGKNINALQLYIIKLAEQFKLTINEDVLKYCNIHYNKELQAKKVDKIFKYVKPIKFVNFANSQNIGIGDYLDYIDQLLTLNYDMKSEINLYPRDFKSAHVELSTLITAQQKKIFETAVATVYDNYHDLCEWSKDGLMVMMAKNCAEIINEGIAQNHCVGNYCERVAKSESIILFLRRKETPEQGFYTMEIRPDMHKLNLIQCRGYGNQDPSQEARAEVDAFLAKYEKWFNRRKVVGFDKNSIYAKYYKAVRKSDDGRYFSSVDRKTEYKIGEICETEVDTNPDVVAAKGLHIASLEFAQDFGNYWKDVAILEVEVNINDVIVPDAKDQIRTRRFKVCREVPMEEMGEWGERHMIKNKTKNVA